MANTTATDESYLRGAIDLAQQARDSGNQPFGAIIAGLDGTILGQGINTEITTKDCTGHAETNAMRVASTGHDEATLAASTLYTSTEPCPMCAAAIYWGGVRRVVFALSSEQLYDEICAMRGMQLRLSSRELFERAEQSVEVVGPLLREEAFRVHEGFWEDS